MGEGRVTRIWKFIDKSIYASYAQEITANAYIELMTERVVRAATDLSKVYQMSSAYKGVMRFTLNIGDSKGMSRIVFEYMAHRGLLTAWVFFVGDQWIMFELEDIKYET